VELAQNPLRKSVKEFATIIIKISAEGKSICGTFIMGMSKIELKIY